MKRHAACLVHAAPRWLDLTAAPGATARPSRERRYPVCARRYLTFTRRDPVIARRYRTITRPCLVRAARPRRPNPGTSDTMIVVGYPLYARVTHHDHEIAAAMLAL